ncbi:MAG TPA: superoxide dismutase [Caulobacteraceae bacterium]|nr:superoxide dismutase [Caulobacteraceae bacterium]
MGFTLPPLPYAQGALEPFISARTMEFHHGKHHKAYVDTTNRLVAGTALEGADLVEVVRRAKASGDDRLRNQAGQVWNHSFFWQCMAPGGGGEPSGELAERIARDFGGFDAFAQAFSKEATSHFASGWGWLVLRGERLEVTSLHDGDSPVAHDDIRPVLTVDVWEHAYYLDYQNQRASFVEAFLKNLVDWDFAARNLDGQGGERANQRG